MSRRFYSMSAWLRSQARESEYDEDKWAIPKSAQYWLDFLKMNDVSDPTLEVGCGASGLWRFSPKVTGLDPIDYSRFGSNFRLGRAEELPYPDNSFKDVVCVNALDHTEDPKKSLCEMARVASERVILWSNVFPMRALYSWAYSPHPHAFTRESLLGLIPKEMGVLKYWDLRPSGIKSGSVWGGTILGISEVLGVRAILLHLVKM
jgi:SAM-dependent methyltransferase